jgi:hypothetical protein
MQARKPITITLAGAKRGKFVSNSSKTNNFDKYSNRQFIIQVTT